MTIAKHCHIASWIAAALLLLFVLGAHLLPALLAGLLVYELVHLLAPRIRLKQLQGGSAKVAVVALIATLVVGGLTALIVGLVMFFRSGAESLPMLMQKMAEILESSRAMLPSALLQYFPANGEGVKESAVHWLKGHADELQTAGREAGLMAAHILIGMIIGAMVSLREVASDYVHGPLASAMIERASRLGDSFRRVVFAQVRIAALNAAFTGVYLAVILPLAGIHLPLAKTMVALTFLLGLLPVVGNLLSNSIIVIVSLSKSLDVAIGSLVFLVVIHKLEYFLNARIVGSQIRAAAWELLLAMLVMESVFGLAGVVAAPIYYAYLKDELAARKLV